MSDICPKCEELVDLCQCELPYLNMPMKRIFSGKEMAEQIAALTARIAELEAQVPRWRDAVNDPPPTDDYCLLFLVNELGRSMSYVGFYNDGNWYTATFTDRGRLPKDRVKKWCELPTPLGVIECSTY